MRIRELFQDIYEHSAIRKGSELLYLKKINNQTEFFERICFKKEAVVKLGFKTFLGLV
jgi:hypothetical protein